MSLHILRGHQRVCIAEVQSKRELRRVIPPGTIQRLVGTSGGEVLLAGADDAMRDNLLAPLDLSGPERAAVIKRINVVAADGYSVLRNKDLGVSALSVPVRRGDGVLAALTASGPGTRFGTTQARECVDEAIACAGASPHAVDPSAPPSAEVLHFPSPPHPGCPRGPPAPCPGLPARTYPQLRAQPLCSATGSSTPES